MRISKNIYYDITESDIKVSLGEYTFTFSSDIYKEKFVNGVENYVKTENNKINAKYGLVGDFKDYLAVIYYKKIEKRGFLVTYKDKLINESSFIKR